MLARGISDKIRVLINAQLHVRFLSQQVYAIFFYAQIAASLERVRITCDIAATNCSEIATGVHEKIFERL